MGSGFDWPILCGHQADGLPIEDGVTVGALGKVATVAHDIGLVLQPEVHGRDCSPSAAEGKSKIKANGF